jgi:hypothetical protein
MLFPQSMDMTQMSNAGTQADNALRGLICQKIYTAVQTGARTTGTVTWTTVTEQNLLTILKELGEQGYSVVLASSTITVNWQ